MPENTSTVIKQYKNLVRNFDKYVTHSLPDTSPYQLNEAIILIILFHWQQFTLISNSDHSSLSAVTSMAQAAAHLCVSQKFSLDIKSIGIQFVVQCSICPGVTFGPLTILLFWKSINCCWLDVMYQPRSSVYTRKSFGLMINAGVRLASNRRLIIGGPEIAIWLNGKNLFG